MHLKLKHIREQDYYLNFRDCYDKLGPVTMAHRVEFFKYDTHGGKPPNKNPIYIAKNRYGQTGSLLIDSYFDLEGGWVGGVYLTWDYWNSKSGLRPLLEWFGSKNVARWVSAFQYIFE